MNKEDEVRKCLESVFKHRGFKSETQKKAILHAVLGKGDTFVVMPTGSGKSFCFQVVGAMQTNKVTIVIGPLVSLMSNQVEYLNSLKISAEMIYSKMPMKNRKRIIEDLKAKVTTTKFLYITPEYAATPTFKEILRELNNNGKIALIAIDEAHCVSTWGHDFRPAYLKLGELRREFPDVRLIALTATASTRVKEDLIQLLGLNQVQSFQTSCFRPNLFYDIISDPKDYTRLRDFIDGCINSNANVNLTGREKPCGLIFCRKRETTEIVVKSLNIVGIESAAYHSKRSLEDRNEIQNKWMNGEIPIIVATTSFGMGIDKGPCRFVVHWDAPQSIAGWYQEAGRAGRDGKKSFCRVYFDKEESNTMKFIMSQKLKDSKDANSQSIATKQNEEYEMLLGFFENPTCFHKFFTDFFGDSAPKCIDNCSSCENNNFKRDVESNRENSPGPNRADEYEVGEASGVDKDIRLSQKRNAFNELSNKVISKKVISKKKKKSSDENLKQLKITSFFNQP